MTETATQTDPARTTRPGPGAQPDGAVTLPEVRPAPPGAPPAPDRVTEPGSIPGTPPSPDAPRAPGTGGVDAPVRRRGRSGPLAGLALSLPGRRGARSNGGGGGGRRWPLRPGEGGDGIDLRNTWQVVAGALLVPLGVVFILIAWYGAAHTPYVQQQVPYLVSGSFAGVACIVLGGLLYWAHWLYRIYDQADLHHQQELEVLHQTLRAIAERLDGSRTPTAPASAPGPDEGAAPVPVTTAAATDPAAPASAADVGTPGSGTGAFVATEDGSYYHLPACPVVAHHSDGMRSIGEPGLSALEPCRICRPNGTMEGHVTES